MNDILVIKITVSHHQGWVDSGSIRQMVQSIWPGTGIGVIRKFHKSIINPAQKFPNGLVIHLTFSLPITESKKIIDILKVEMLPIMLKENYYNLEIVLI